MSWLSVAASRTWDSISHPIDTATSIASGTVDVAKSAWGGVKWAGGKAVDGVKWTGGKIKDGATLAWNDPKKAASIVGNGIATAAKETGNFIKYAATNPTRAGALVLQGGTNALASTVGMVGDLGEALLWNNTLRHVANFGLEKGNKFAKHEHDYAKSLTEKVRWTREIDPLDPNANYERVMLYGAQAIGEIPAFMIVGAATAGTGAFAWGALRGGAAVARSTNYIRRSADLIRASNTLAKPFGEAAYKLSTLAPRFTGATHKGYLEAGKAWRLFSPFEKNGVLTRASLIGESVGGVTSGGMGFVGDLSAAKKLALAENQKAVDDFYNQQTQEQLKKIGNFNHLAGGNSLDNVDGTTPESAISTYARSGDGGSITGTFTPLGNQSAAPEGTEEPFTSSLRDLGSEVTRLALGRGSAEEYAALTHEYDG